MFIYFRLGPSYCLLREKWRKDWKLQRGQIYLHQHCKLRNIALVLVFPWRDHYKGFSRRERIGSKQHRHIEKFTVLERRKIILSSFYKILCRKQIPWGELVCAKKNIYILAWSSQWRPPKLQNGYQTWLKTLDLYLFIPLVPKVTF